MPTLNPESQSLGDMLPKVDLSPLPRGRGPSMLAAAVAEPAAPEVVVLVGAPPPTAVPLGTPSSAQVALDGLATRLITAEASSVWPAAAAAAWTQVRSAATGERWWRRRGNGKAAVAAASSRCS